MGRVLMLWQARGGLLGAMQGTPPGCSEKALYRGRLSSSFAPPSAFDATYAAPETQRAKATRTRPPTREQEACELARICAGGRSPDTDI